MQGVHLCIRSQGGDCIEAAPNEDTLGNYSRCMDMASGLGKAAYP